MTSKCTFPIIVFLLVNIATGQFFGSANMIELNYSPCPQVPTLHCRNGSQCAPGKASFGTQHDHLDLQEHDNGYYCKCKAGFIGHECEIEVDECAENKNVGNGPPSCYYGAKCLSNGKSVYCDCNALNQASGDTDTKFAGLMCQHESTSFCASTLTGSNAPNHQFCTNHGKCVKMVLGNELHPGCECSPGWMGDHCELRQDPFAVNKSKESTQEGKSNGMKVMIISLVCAGVFLAVSMALVSMRYKSMKKNARSPEVEFKGGEQLTGRKFAGDLDADGSGTLGTGGNEENEENGDSDGELVMKDEDGDGDDEDVPDDRPAPLTEIV